MPDQAGVGSSGSDSTSVPLAQLVRDNPDVGCTNCKNKGVKCTTEQILNPAKPNKGGRRIEEARKRFGGNGAEGRGEATPAAEGMDASRGQVLAQTQDGAWAQTVERPGSDENMVQDMEEMGEMDWGAFMNLPGMDVLLAGLDTTGGSGTVPTADTQSGIRPTSLESTLDLSTFTFPTEQDALAMPWELPGMPSNGESLAHIANDHDFSTADQANSRFDFSNDNPVPLLEPFPAKPTMSPSTNGQGRAPSRTPEPSGLSTSPFFHQSLVNALGQRDFEAHGIWSDLNARDAGTRTPSQAQAQLSDLGPKFRSGSSPASVTLEGHTTSSPSSGLAPAMPRAFKFDGGPTKFISYDATPAEIIASQAQVFTNKALNPRATYRPETSSTPLSMYFQPGQQLVPVGREASLAPARKRHREEFSPSPGSEDPWRLWSENGGELVRWGRREVVQQRLADRALGGEMSKHLVVTYFHCVHPSFPVSTCRARSPSAYLPGTQPRGVLS